MTRCSTGRSTQKYKGGGTDLSDILESEGDIIYADATLSAENLVISGTPGDVLKVSASGIPEWGTSTSQWATSGNDISYITGNVGIGTTSPDATLHVVGNTFVSTDLGLGGTLTMGTVLVEALHELSAITATGNVTPHVIEFTNPTTGFVTTGNVSMGKDLTVAGNVAVDTNTLFVDSVNNRVGIGTSTPQYRLDVGSGGGDVMLRVMNGLASTGKLLFGCTGSADTRSSAIEVRNNGDGGNNYMKFLVHDGGGVSPFEGRTEVMTLRGDGNVGIGTNAPGYPLDVNGAIRYSGTTYNTTLLGSDTVPMKDIKVNSSALPAANWYRIAKNGQALDGQTGGDRCMARFTIVDTKTAQHSYRSFYAGGTFRREPFFHLLSNTSYTDGGVAQKVRIVQSSGSDGEGIGIDVYLDVEPAAGQFQVVMDDNYYPSGYVLVDFEADPDTTGMDVFEYNLDDLMWCVSHDSASSGIFLKKGGNVGIGTTTPGYILDVSGDINFTGEIRKGGVIQSFGGGSSPWTYTAGSSGGTQNLVFDDQAPGTTFTGTLSGNANNTAIRDTTNGYIRVTQGGTSLTGSVYWQTTLTNNWEATFEIYILPINYGGADDMRFVFYATNPITTNDGATGTDGHGGAYMRWEYYGSDYVELYDHTATMITQAAASLQMSGWMPVTVTFNNGVLTSTITNSGGTTLNTTTHDFGTTYAALYNTPTYVAITGRSGGVQAEDRVRNITINALNVQTASTLTRINTNVGIGTITPAYTLDVTGDINFTGALTQNGSAYGGGSSPWVTSGSVISYTTGDVGIGTNIPQGTLHLSSGTTGDCRLILQADTDNNDEGDNPRIEFWQDGAIQESAIGMTSNRLNFWNSVGDGGIAFHTGTVDGWTNAIERMTITSSGNIGINKTIPNYTLDVVGDINFTGEIRKGGVIQSFGGGSGGSSPWVTSGNDISYSTGTVKAAAFDGVNKVIYATAEKAVSTWTSRAIVTNAWSSVTWSPELTLFVAVAATGTTRAATSPDGVVWTNRTIDMGSLWSSVTWSPELSLFVAVADGGAYRAATSPDGITWTNRTIAVNYWSSVTWSPELSLFVAVAYTGTNRVATSPDGVTWTGRTIAANNWGSVTWSPELSLFVAVAYGGVATSPDGVTWTNGVIDTGGGWWGVTWSPELSLFVAVANTGTNRAATSPDGITWTGRSIDANSQWYGVTWSPELSLFVAVAANGTTRAATSPDGVTWTNRAIDTGSAWRDVTWSPELSLFVAVAASGTNRVATSDLGIPTSLNTPMAHPGQLHVDTATGNVGVGTSTPTVDLDVAGDITCTGTIRHRAFAFYASASGGQIVTGEGILSDFSSTITVDFDYTPTGSASSNGFRSSGGPPNNQGTYFAPVDGIYHVSCKVRLPDAETAQQEIQWYIKRTNGNEDMWESFEMWMSPADGGGRRASMSSAIVKLSTGEGIFPRADGATVTLNRATFGGHFLGTY